MLNVGRSMFCGWSIAVLLPLVAMAFTPPSEKTIRDTIGDVSGLPAPLQRAFAPDRNSFDPIPKPTPNDWNDQPTHLSCSFRAHSTLNDQLSTFCQSHNWRSHLSGIALGDEGHAIVRCREVSRNA